MLGGQQCCFLAPAAVYLAPCRYWAIAIPSAIFVTWSVAVLVYIAVNFMSTAPLDSFDTITGTRLLPCSPLLCLLSDDFSLP